MKIFIAKHRYRGILVGTVKDEYFTAIDSGFMFQLNDD